MLKVTDKEVIELFYIGYKDQRNGNLRLTLDDLQKMSVYNFGYDQGILGTITENWNETEILKGTRYRLKELM